MKVEFVIKTLWCIFKKPWLSCSLKLLIRNFQQYDWLGEIMICLCYYRKILCIRKKNKTEERYVSEFDGFYFFDARWKRFLWLKCTNLLFLCRCRGGEESFVCFLKAKRTLILLIVGPAGRRSCNNIKDMILKRNPIHLRGKMRNDWEMTLFKTKQNSDKLCPLRITRKKY